MSVCLYVCFQAEDDDEDDDDEFGGQDTMVTGRPGPASEFTSSTESSLEQYTQDTLVIREDQPGVGHSVALRACTFSQFKRTCLTSFLCWYEAYK